MLDWYLHIPLSVDPVAFSLGFFAVRWYALMYAFAYLTVYVLLAWRVKKNEGEWDRKTMGDCLLASLLGAIIGGRLGYILLYDFAYYSIHPLQIVSPYDPISGTWTGIYGMSYFGGLLGALFFGWRFARKRGIDFWRLADFAVPAVPLGYFWGRIGNFLNGELYGRETVGWWGMYFSQDSAGVLRHPSQLYEAFFEGVVLFVALWLLRNKIRFSGQLILTYIIGYSFFRFLIEFVREPDMGSGLASGIFTWGQIYAVLAGLIGIWLYWKRKNNNAILNTL